MDSGCVFPNGSNNKKMISLVHLGIKPSAQHIYIYSLGNFQPCKKILGKNISMSRPNQIILLDHPKRGFFYSGSYLKFFKLKLYQFSRKPSRVSVEFSDPAMFIPL